MTTVDQEIFVGKIFYQQPFPVKIKRAKYFYTFNFLDYDVRTYMYAQYTFLHMPIFFTKTEKIRVRENLRSKIFDR